MHGLGAEIDVVDGSDAIVNARVELTATGANDVLGMGQPEGNEQQARLVDMAIVLIDHRDGRLAAPISLSQAVGGQGPAGSAAQDDDAMHVRTPIFSISA